MIFAILRLSVVAFIVMLVVYFILSAWSRSVRRGKLGEEWDEDVREGDRDAFIEQGLEEYDGSLRRKLILGVFVVPYLVIGVLVYVVNFQ
jgi:Na+/H+ antiporter NhaC